LNANAHGGGFSAVAEKNNVLGERSCVCAQKAQTLHGSVSMDGFVLWMLQNAFRQFGMLFVFIALCGRLCRNYIAEVAIVKAIK